MTGETRGMPSASYHTRGREIVLVDVAGFKGLEMVVEPRNERGVV